jgi:hypothetical protein
MRDPVNIFTNTKPKNNFFTLSDKILVTIVALGLTMVLLSVLSLIIKWQNLPPQVPLFYSKPWGNEQLATKTLLWFLPTLSVVIWLIDLLLIRTLLKNDEFLSRILAIFGVLSAILISFTLVKIILQVGG